MVSPLRKLLPEQLARYHHYLCVDEQTAGFLLNNISDKWPIACVWTGKFA